MEYYLAIKEQNNTTAATWMDLEIVTLSEVSQRKTNSIWYCLYVESKKKSINELTYKTEIELQM